MSKKKRVLISIGLWVLAFFLTMVIALYQKMTGPTWSIMDKETIKGKEISYRFLRSFTAFKELPVAISVSDPSVTAFLNYKRYKVNEEWKKVEMKQRDKNQDKDSGGHGHGHGHGSGSGNGLFAKIPGQPAAGKVEYSVRVVINGESFLLNKSKSIVARFKGEVPTVFLIIHVIFMFFSILFALRTGMEALRKQGNYGWLVGWTLGLTFIGGMILGPIVQQYAFGDLWTGFPFGFDLTDNKVLIAVIFWVLAFFLKKKNKWSVVLAAAVMIIVYLIPHSVLGSELDYQTGKMKNKYSMMIQKTTVMSRIR
ncbi:MAG: hypothetical protein GTO45_40760 [Candidatus Aminicenantes bacterium]|nr:hypothetical protein [Candidatus Aminicenantes bacterium]NIM84936.1 hypothetical protein [Candidatus Aminicenantes bacterium]NIN24450.1 hypothetical protein [Candidatus Aminicenantes bacterium]NIN48214.1 hypothetical protein [Candidatus Aminicenantes bacterium]NIN91117.1 hypothetical protein [Candidatus Aminicenantes bacterium]